MYIKDCLCWTLPPSQSCGCAGYDEHGEYIYIYILIILMNIDEYDDGHHDVRFCSHFQLAKSIFRNKVPK